MVNMIYTKPQQNHNKVWTMCITLGMYCRVNTLRPRQNYRHFTDDIFKYIFLTEYVWSSLKISLKFVPKVSINNIPALVQIMVWHWPGDQPLSEPMMVKLMMHICIKWPQWFKMHNLGYTCAAYFYLCYITHLPLDKMDITLQKTFSNAFSLKKWFVFWFIFHWGLFLRVQVTISQHWLVTEQVTSHYLNQCWPSSLMHICGIRGR